MKKLSEYAVKHGSDKWNHHYYCDHYERHFAEFQKSQGTFIELGIGGYECPDRGGAGLKMWREWFASSMKVVGIDLHDKSGITWPNKKNLDVFQGSQDDAEFLRWVIGTCGRPSIIVDDASHMNNLTRRSFDILFRELVPGGIYVIEDIESSWWEDHGFDGCEDPHEWGKATTANFIRSLINDVCYRRIANYRRKYDVDSVHVYDNIVFIHKMK